MHSIAWWPILIVMILATITDLWSRRIPNWLVVPFLVAGIAVRGFSGGWRGLGQSVLGAILGALVLGVFYWAGGMGMGDVKLFASAGAWIGPFQLIFAFVFMGLAGGLIALGCAIYGGYVGDWASKTSDLIFGLRARGFHGSAQLNLSNPKARKMPYAPAIAIGTILSFFALG